MDLTSKLAKIFLVMRLTLLLVLAASLQLPARGLSQSVKLSVKEEKLAKVFSLIKQQANCVFFYDEAILKDARPVTVNTTSPSLDAILQEVMKNQPFGYMIQDRTVNVFKKNTPPPTQTALSIEATPPPPITVHGRVTNEKGEAVAGVTVAIKGTQQRTATNDNGEFTIVVNDANATLVFSAVTIEAFETKLNGRTELALRAKSKVEELQDVTVERGYYSTSRRLNTGSVSVVKGEDIEKQPVANPLAALEGRVTGLYIQQRSGLPGDNFTVRLRGQNSIAQGNDPLYIVDGVPFLSGSLSQRSSIIINSPFNYLDPSDIESITVLKDADATAIYGSRGANGVILITTKKGRADGRTNVDFNIQQGIGQVGHFVDLLHTKDYLTMRREAFKYDNATPGAADYDVNGSWDTTRYTDWQRELIGGTAHYTDIQASVSGGNSNTQFLFGGGYHRETTVLPGDFADVKGSVHFNLNHASPNQRFKASLSLNYMVDKTNLATRDLTNFALTLAPDAPALFNPDGSLNWANSTWASPLSYLLNLYRANANNLVGNSIISYEIIPGLLVKTSFGYSNVQFQEATISPIAANDPAKILANPANITGTSAFGNNTVNSWIIEPQLDYKKSFKFGQFNFLIGATFQEKTNTLSQIQGSGFTSDALIEIVQASPRVTATNSSSDYKYNAVFGRINYNYQNKYLVNLTARRDGSSRFGPGRQFGNFGAAGIGWIFTKEQFVTKNLAFLSFGKIRASYGVTGNDQTNDYQFLDTYSATSFTYQGNSALFPTALFNSDFGWETNKKFELGVDLGFLRDRIMVNVSHYRNRSDNQLVGYPLPPNTGSTTIVMNLPAVVQNTGYEAEINTVNIKSKDLTWTSSANISFPRNVLVDYPNIAGSSYANKYTIGQSLFMKKTFHYLGQDPQTGLFMFDTKNANGVPTSPVDLQMNKLLGQDFFGGFLNAVKYKNWQIDVFFQFVKQNVNSIYQYLDIPGRLTNQPTDVMQRWQQPGDNTGFEQFTRLTTLPAGQRYNAFKSSDGIIVDGSFVRLKNVSVSYFLPSSWLKPLRIQRVRLYMQGQNLLTFTKYVGPDPEQSVAGAMPSLRVITGGLQVTF